MSDFSLFFTLQYPDGNMHLESQETSVKAGGTENCHVTKDCINDDAHCTLA